MHQIRAKGILSPENGMNVYRGCTHGCIYCDSRSRCYHIDHDFEDIGVKINAPELLEAKLRGKREKCMIGTGAMCDPYMHAEEKLRLTRTCLELIRRYGFGAAVQTKSARVLRDLDVLRDINSATKAVVQMTLTTFDEKLCRILEPNVSTTRERFEALKVFRDEGIPAIVWLTPLLPFINDTEENVLGILEMCREAKVKGIIAFGMGLTLREGSREYFYAALDKHFPGMKQRYADTYGLSYELPTPNAESLMRLFRDFCTENGILYTDEACFRYLHEFPKQYEQLSRF